MSFDQSLLSIQQLSIKARVVEHRPKIKMSNDIKTIIAQRRREIKSQNKLLKYLQSAVEQYTEPKYNDYEVISFYSSKYFCPEKDCYYRSKNFKKIQQHIENQHLVAFRCLAYDCRFRCTQ